MWLEFMAVATDIYSKAVNQFTSDPTGYLKSAVRDVHPGHLGPQQIEKCIKISKVIQCWVIKVCVNPEDPYAWCVAASIAGATAEVNHAIAIKVLANEYGSWNLRKPATFWEIPGQPPLPAPPPGISVTEAPQPAAQPQSPRARIELDTQARTPRGVKARQGSYSVRDLEPRQQSFRVSQFALTVVQAHFHGRTTVNMDVCHTCGSPTFGSKVMEIVLDRACAVDTNWSRPRHHKRRARCAWDHLARTDLEMLDKVYALFVQDYQQGLCKIQAWLPKVLSKHEGLNIPEGQVVKDPRATVLNRKVNVPGYAESLGRLKQHDAFYLASEELPAHLRTVMVVDNRMGDESTFGIPIPIGLVYDVLNWKQRNNKKPHETANITADSLSCRMEAYQSVCSEFKTILYAYHNVSSY